MKFTPKPEWLRIKMRSNSSFSNVSSAINHNGLNTICSSGRCPNRSECWSRGTATIMILGDICTRSCKFCNTKTGRPLPPDPTEPLKTALAIQTLQLKHAVITSVDRDDLPDKGASVWAETIQLVKQWNPHTTLEVLIPDFDGNTKLIDQIVMQKPDIISHNIETVRRLTPLVRSKAQYNTSLSVLRHIASTGITTKTGIMLGLGETEPEIFEFMNDVILQHCYILTMGQYLQPSRKHTPVIEYVNPEKFAEYKTKAHLIGFKIVESGPLVRSSYHAEKHI